MDTPTKRCTKCGEVKPLNDFYGKGGNRKGHHAACKPCHSRESVKSAQKYWGDRAPKARSRKMLQYRSRKEAGLCVACGKTESRDTTVLCDACFQTQREANPQYEAKMWSAAIEAYGGRCVCCGESHPYFLTLDHVNGDGAAEKRTYPSGSTVRWAYKNGFPDSLRLLCWNCNCARYFRGDGGCPHETGEFFSYRTDVRRVHNRDRFAEAEA
jgi:hypothetical protein